MLVGVTVLLPPQKLTLFYEKEIDSCNFDGTISNVVGGQHYNVSVFVVKENGFPFNRAATIPQVVVVVKGM